MITKDSSNMWCGGFSGMLWSFVTTLCSPNEDFGTTKNSSMGRFWSTFHTNECYIWAKRDEKYFKNDPSNYFSTFQNLRLGSINFARWLQKIVACDVMCWLYGMLWSSVRCNNFARWLQKIVASDVMCWFSGMSWSFVTTLQDDYKR